MFSNKLPFPLVQAKRRVSAQIAEIDANIKYCIEQLNKTHLTLNDIREFATTAQYNSLVEAEIELIEPVLDVWLGRGNISFRKDKAKVTSQESDKELAEAEKKEEDEQKEDGKEGWQVHKRRGRKGRKRGDQIEDERPDVDENNNEEDEELEDNEEIRRIQDERMVDGSVNKAEDGTLYQFNDGLTSADPETALDVSANVLLAVDLWQLSMVDKRKLYASWVHAYRQKKKETLQELSKEYETLCKEKLDLEHEIQLDLLRTCAVGTIVAHWFLFPSPSLLFTDCYFRQWA